MNSLCDAGQVTNSDPRKIFLISNIVFCSEMSQKSAIAVSNFKEVNVSLIGYPLHLEISEVDFDDIAFGNFDSFPLVKIVQVF